MRTPPARKKQIERTEVSVAYDQPNEITIAAMKEKWNEFIATL